ncbi:MAG: DUF4325 domain-containing protein [Rhodobacteraceae bacterium]|nr:DUF4325 domain-containing protein [Paracoccaceae bacterium]
MTTINIASDFSRIPAGRTEENHGPHSGEAFRKRHLIPKLTEAINSRSELVVVLDGAAGYPAAFLDEAFGGLIREGRWPKKTVVRHLDIRAESPAYEIYKILCLRYIKESSSRVQRN